MNDYTCRPVKSKPNFNNYNSITGKSFCVFCLKGLPPIKKDKLYSTDTYKWKRQYHKGGSCADRRDTMMMFDYEDYKKRIAENKLLITEALTNNKTPAQQQKINKKLLDKKK